LRQLFQCADFFAIDLVNDSSAIGAQVGINGIRQNIGQNDDIRMLQIDLVEYKVIKEMAKAQIGWLISLE